MAPLISGDVVERLVEDRKRDAARRVKVNRARERLPGFVDAAAAFVEKSAAVAIDDDSVWIGEHHGFGFTAAWIDGLDVHTAPVARRFRSRRDGHRDALRPC